MADSQITEELGAALMRHEQAQRRAVEEYAAKWTAEKRRDAAKRGDALADGSYPIIDQEDMANAARLLGNGSASKPTVVAHMKKQARKHGLKLPDSLR